MTKLLKASLILATPLFIAAYGDRDSSAASGATVSVGAEGAVSVVNIGWGVATTNDDSVASMQNYTNFVLHESHDKGVNYTFGGAVIAKTDLTEDFGVMLRFGFESGLKDANGPAVDLAGIDGDATSTWKSKMTMSPAAFIGFNGLYLGAVYDMREYDVTTSGVAALNTTVKENQFLFGMRGETVYSMEDMNITVAFEGVSSFYQKADKDVEDWFDGLNNDQLGNASNNYYANHTKLSFSLGMMFADF